MSKFGYAAEHVGICLSTLIADPRQVDGAGVEAVLRACRAAGLTTVATGSSLAEAMGIDRFRRCLIDLEMEVRVIEAIVGWTQGPEPAREETTASAAFASAVGADALMAATIAPDLDLNRATEGFAAACEAAARAGLRVPLEFIPGTAVPDLKTAWRIVRDSGADNAGVVVDFLHWYHQPGGPDMGTLRSIPPERIQYVQLCDSPDIATPAGAEYIPFAMTDRAVPGEGVVDFESLLETLSGMGADPYFALEVFNSNLLATGADNMAAQLRTSVNKMLE